MPFKEGRRIAAFPLSVQPSRLAVSEICAILEKSKELGVTKITVYGVEVYFGPPGPAEVTHDYSDLRASQRPAMRYDYTDRDDEPAPQTLMTLADRQAQEETRTAQLMIDDPIAYEQEMIAASLERERTIAQG